MERERGRESGRERMREREKEEEIEKKECEKGQTIRENRRDR